ncbi:MAG: YlxM family DNA-binding protein [Peptococcaceae bacterium]|nr:YlxM family DNA-binding protein [Peptococcaceae bacterium]
MDLEKTAWMNLLFDFYGQLLTGRQNTAIELYYGQNLSLKEIADEVSVSRQAIHVSLKRAENLLIEYEEKLGLVAKFLEQKDRLQEVVDLLDGYHTNGESGQCQRAREILTGILDA